MKNTYLFLFSFFLTFQSFAQFPTNLADKLQFILEIYDNSSNPYGISVAVNTNDYGTWESTVGFSHPPVTLDTSMLLGIGSNTKLFTSVLCLKLADNGQLDLDDPISTWLPTYTNIDPTITLRQLLQHASGIDDYVDYLLPDTVIDKPNHVWTPTEVLTYIGPQKFAPGTSVGYSSTNFYLAAMILEQVTGRTYTDLVHDSILSPLHMNHTYLEGWENVQGTVAHPWHVNTDFVTVSRVAVGTASWAAGCIVSTPKEMADWYMKLFNTNFLSTQSIHDMTSFINWPNRPYKMGLGIYLSPNNGDTLWGHSGQTIGYNSLTYFHPEQNFSISVIINDTYKNPNGVTSSLVKEIIKQLTILGTDEISNENTIFEVFPNPNNAESLTVKSMSARPISNIQILDINGHLVYHYSGQPTSKLHINTSEFSTGIYIVLANDGQNIYREKLVVY